MKPSTTPSAVNDYISSGFFVLRTPLLPIEDLLTIAQGRDRPATRARLRQWLEQREVQEALWLASPDFLQSLVIWQNQPESPKGQRLERALYRYLARMTARATPFGGFAGCSVGANAAETHLELASRDHYRRSTHLDMEYLCNLAETISADPVRRGKINFRCNTSLHLAAERYHHLRGRQHETGRQFQLVATEPTLALDATLLRASSGSSAEALAEALVESDPEITRADADVFIDRLIASEMLVSDLVPPITGREPVDFMIDQLARADVPCGQLRSAAEKLHALDQQGVGADLRAYDAIAGTLSDLGAEFKPGRLVHMDVIKPAAALTLGEGLVDEILRGATALHSLRADSTQEAFDAFREQFVERYQDREVALLEALDDEAGIGFENEDNPTSEPLIDGIDFRPRHAEAVIADDGEGAPENRESQKEAGPVLSRRLEAMRANRQKALELDAELMDELKAADPLPLPDAFSAIGVCFRAPDGKEGFHLQSVSGPSGANLLARFCHADERLTQCVQEHAQAEEALAPAGAVFAEIAHLPEGRVGNVVRRPLLRHYEIPFLAGAGAPPGRQLALSDLTVSVREGRIVLRSRRLRCEVLPRLSSAHNFASPRSLKLYKFLCLLQHQGTCPELSWHWGSLGEEAFLPRVTMGHIIFSLARWRISRETAPRLFAPHATPDVRLQAWRNAQGLPRFAYIAQADNHLLIDFESSLAVDVFLEHIRKQPETLLVEMFPQPADLVVQGPEGSFVHEVVLPFVRSKPSATAAMQVKSARARSDVVSRADASTLHHAPPPDSEWLFAKLYCSPSHADRLLLELVRPLLAEISRTAEPGASPLWFFLRYADPHWHLRLRFHGDPGYLQGQVLPAFLERATPFQRQGVLWRLAFDAYQPELERYGGPHGVAVAERLFHLDSQLCLELLPLVTGDDRAERRWQLALAGTVRLLSGLGFNTADQKALAEILRDDREENWVVDDTYRQQLASKFRSAEMRSTLAAILAWCEDQPGTNAAQGGSSSAEPTIPDEAMSALLRYSRSLPAIREELRTLEQDGRLTATMAQLAASYVHMHLNRIFRACHLEQEAVLCDLLARACASKLAQERRTR
ncbi:MAG TPA: lantibiotic dehydratase [Candidatus Angelobacter sp.]|nr:lantibiotic dehydratase [Candidatus Angelobacter sp.]